MCNARLVRLEVFTLEVKAPPSRVLVKLVKYLVERRLIFNLADDAPGLVDDAASLAAISPGQSQF